MPRLFAVAVSCLLLVAACDARDEVAPPATPTATPTATSPSTDAPQVQQAVCVGPYEQQPQQGLSTDGVRSFLTDFAQARVAGRGAEDCLSEEAVGIYEREGADRYQDEALCLYACGEWRVVAFDVSADPIITSSPDGTSFEVSLGLVIEGPDGERVETTEFLGLAEGMSATGKERQLVVVSAGADL